MAKVRSPEELAKIRKQSLEEFFGPVNIIPGLVISNLLETIDHLVGLLQTIDDGLLSCPVCALYSPDGQRHTAECELATVLGVKHG